MPTFYHRFTVRRPALAGALIITVLGIGQPLAAQPQVTSGSPHHGGLDEEETFNVVWGEGLDWTPCIGHQNIVWSNSTWNDDGDGDLLALVWEVELSDGDDAPCGVVDPGATLESPADGAASDPPVWRPAGALGGPVR